MNSNAQVRVSLLGASVDTQNMGVNVLAAGAVKCVLSQFPRASVSFFDYGPTPTVHTVRLEGRDVRVPKVNIRFSKKLFLPNNIALLLVLAALARIPLPGFRKWIIAKNKCLLHLEEADLVLSVAGGDSFSDIYGLRRLLYVSLPQILVVLMRKKLVLLPQTYGPFKRAFSRMVARSIVKRADHVYARDHRSLEFVQSLVNSERFNKKSSFCFDLGFVVDPIPPANQDQTGLPAEAARTKPLAGINISGLLFNGGYTGDNMFGLRADYRSLIRNFIEFFITQKDAVVLLVPHVFGTEGGSESDWVVCNQLWAELKNKYGPALRLVQGTYDQSELKFIIGKCDFFVGARMHACIAAVSQGVPAVSIAYSDKFIGVMESIGVAATVADARHLDEQEILAIIDRSFQQRAVLHDQLTKTMPHVRDTVLGLLDPSCNPSQ